MTDQIKAKTAERIQTELYVKKELSSAINVFERAYRLKVPRLNAVYSNLMVAFVDYYTCFGKHHSKEREYAAFDISNYH